MIRKHRIAFIVAASCLLVVATAPVRLAEVHAQTANVIPDLAGEPDEIDGYVALNDGSFIKARELGERILKRNPDSFAGHFVLGGALHRGEGDLPRALKQLELARTGYETRFEHSSEERPPIRWHASILLELSTVLGELDRCQDQLDVLTAFDTRYQPQRPAARIWPLMKLRRYDEAREAVQKAIASGDENQRKGARADLCGAESEAGDRMRAYEACTEATRDFRGDPSSGGQLEYSNASDAALEVFRHDEAERNLKEAIARPSQIGWVNPFQQLGELYLAEGRVAEAIEAMRGAQALRLTHPAALDQFVQARVDATLAELFLVVGIPDRAVAAARRAAEQPDRQGHASGTEAQAQSAAELVLAATLHEMAVREEEDAVTANFVDGIALRGRALWHRMQAYRQRRRAVVALSDEAFLVKSLRPYYLGMTLSVWMFPDAVDAAGSGVVMAGLERARKEDRIGGVEKYFAAWEVEAAWERGDCETARVGAIKAASELPRAEVMLAARMHAIAGACALRDGDEDAATGALTTVLEKDPGLMRRLEIVLPVTVDTDGSGLAERAAKLVARSPRFSVRHVSQAASFRVMLSGGQQPRACLFGPQNAQLACASVNLPVDTGDDAGARLLIAEFHRGAFALKADLSQADLTTLDGSPTAARADQKVRSVLDKLGGD